MLVKLGKMEFLVFTLKISCEQQGWLVWGGIHLSDEKEKREDQDQASLCSTERASETMGFIAQVRKEHNYSTFISN